MKTAEVYEMLREHTEARQAEIDSFRTDIVPIRNHLGLRARVHLLPPEGEENMGLQLEIHDFRENEKLGGAMQHTGHWTTQIKPVTPQLAAGFIHRGIKEMAKQLRNDPQLVKGQFHGAQLRQLFEDSLKSLRENMEKDCVPQPMQDLTRNMGNMQTDHSVRSELQRQGHER